MTDSTTSDGWTLEQRELATILATAIRRHQILTYASPRPPQHAEEPTECHDPTDAPKTPATPCSTSSLAPSATPSTTSAAN